MLLHLLGMVLCQEVDESILPNVVCTAIPIALLVVKVSLFVTNTCPVVLLQTAEGANLTLLYEYMQRNA